MSVVQPTEPKTPAEYLAMIPDNDRRRDMKKLHAIIRKAAPSLEPSIQMGMIAYGYYHYRYASGREGDWFVIGLSSRAAYISLYVCATKDGRYVAEGYRKALPKADIGKSCVRFKRLDDLDAKTLERLIRESAKMPAAAVNTATAEKNPAKARSAK